MAETRALPSSGCRRQAARASRFGSPAPPLRARFQSICATLSRAAKRTGRTGFRRAEDGALFALTRGTLRCLLSAATGVPAEEIAFAEGSYGKPCLVGTNGPHFNVSHSGCWALIGFSDRRDIGVDIEFMRAAGGELDLARSFFSAAEYRSLEGLANNMLLSSFYKIWTCKEAVLQSLRRRNFRASQGFFGRIDC